jgi:hypothetical protein
LRYKWHVTSKYPVWVCALALFGAACTPQATVPPPSATTTPTTAASPTAPPTAAAPVSPIAVTALQGRTWYTVPDGFFKEAPAFFIRFAEDASAARPRIRIEPAGREVALVRTPGTSDWTAIIDDLAVGSYTLRVVERLAGGDTAVEPVWTIRISQPEYVVWTLDFEGDAASDETMANTAAIADGLKVPMVVMWNPRAWTTTQVSAAQADAMLAWTKGRGAKGDEVALHLHMWTDYVRAAGVTPRAQPSWAGRGDGYDVPITAYTEEEQRTLIAHGLKLMSDHGLSGITSFRAGGDFGDAATLRALVANGITADCTAVPAGSFGSLRWPWTLAPDAQPYRPSRDDANRPGDLPLLEVPTNGGNTYGYNAATIAPIVRADLAMLAKAGEVARERRAITVVSHPGTIDAAERGAIESLFRALAPLRYDADAGPLRFVTLRQLAQAWK